MTDFSDLRRIMVERHIAGRDIDSTALLDAFRTVPREEFVSPALVGEAYADRPLPLGFGQTISQPYIVALTIHAAGIGREDKVLEIGAGSGYAAAIISRIAARVIAIERLPALAGPCRDRLHRLGYDNVTIVEGDGTCGCADEAPFDAIVAAASGSHIPQILIDQLKPGGRIVMPIGDPGSIQVLVKGTKREDGALQLEDLGGVRFVPLIGENGF